MCRKGILCKKHHTTNNSIISIFWIYTKILFSVLAEDVNEVQPIYFVPVWRPVEDHVLFYDIHFHLLLLLLTPSAFSKWKLPKNNSLRLFQSFKFFRFFSLCLLAVILPTILSLLSSNLNLRLYDPWRITAYSSNFCLKDTGSKGSMQHVSWTQISNFRYSNSVTKD